jgi:thioredoxin reductase
VTRYLEPLAAALGDRIRTGVRVAAVTRRGMDRTRSAGRDAAPFLLRTTDGGVVLARAVIDASGTWSSPNPLASDGLDGDRPAAVLGPLPDVAGNPGRFAGRTVAVVGAGHSAATTLLQLAELAEREPGTRILWVLRNDRAARITASDEDGLPARASMGARLAELVAAGVIEVVDRFEIDAAAETEGGVRLDGRRAGRPFDLEAEIVVAATGFRPDLGLLREIRLCLDDIVEAPLKLAPLIDPNLHSCGTVPPHGVDELRHPEPGFFLAGAKSYGRAPTFLLATGYEQVRSIAAELAGDHAAARMVHLELPATGVCSTDTSSGCCT